MKLHIGKEGVAIEVTFEDIAKARKLAAAFLPPGLLPVLVARLGELFAQGIPDPAHAPPRSRRAK